MPVFHKRLAALLLLLCLAAPCAFAASAVRDGLSVSLSVDKTSLEYGDTLFADVVLHNRSGMAYQDVSIVLEHPAVLVPEDGAQAAQTYAGVLNGKQLSLTVPLTAVPDPSSAAVSPGLPATGDGAHPLLWCLLLAASLAGLARLRRQSARRLSALLLCAALAAPAACPAYADNESVTLRVSETVTVAGQEVTLTAVVRCTPVVVGENTRELRALYIVEETFPAGYSDFPNEFHNNTALLERMFSKATPEGLPFAAEYACRDLTQQEILARIADLAAEQDEQDVAFFYITCHGAFDEIEKVYTNELFLSDGSRLSVPRLADALAAIPGRVIVVLDYCGSGLAIGRSAAPAAQDGYEQFARQAMDAFAAADLRAARSGVQRDGSLLAEGKFCVITGASGTQSSWTNTERGSYLLQWMNSGVMEADADGSGHVTLREMGLYLQEQGLMKSFYEFGSVVHMIPQFYPEKSSYPLFRK